MRTDTKVKLNSEENTLKQIRQALGMSLREFAKQIGADHTSVFRWENGKTKPMFSISQIKALQREMAKIGMTWEDIPDDLTNN